MLDFDENARLPTGETSFDGELDPLAATIDCTATERQLYMAREGHPEQWNQTWQNLETIITDLVTDKCALLADLTVQVGVMTTHGAPQLTVQVKQDLQAARLHPHEQAGALSDPGWMHN